MKYELADAADRANETIGPDSTPYQYYPEIAHTHAADMAISASVENPTTAYPEEDRTVAALFTQGYLHGGNKDCWDLLTKYQDSKSRLTPETYQSLSNLSREAMPDPEIYLAVEYGNTIHDAYKDKTLLAGVGLGREGNHDEAVRRLFLPEYQETRRRDFPSLESGEFNERQLRIIEGMLQGDFIRFAQSQASESEIEKLAQMPHDILLANIMHGVHDLGGAMGHKNATTSLTLDEPAAVRLLDVAFALLATPADLDLPPDTLLTGNQRQQIYGSLRAIRLGIHNDMDQVFPEMPAKLAVADMLRCYSATDFAVPGAAFERLPLALRTAWAGTKALPLLYPEADERFEGMGTEYGPAFLRTFGKSEADTYVALGCFAQIQLHANAIPFDIAVRQDEEWPASAPYQKINFYHIIDGLKAAPPTPGKPVWLCYSIEEGILTPRVLSSPSSGGTDTYIKRLSHPDDYILAGGL